MSLEYVIITVIIKSLISECLCYDYYSNYLNYCKLLHT